MGWNVYNDPGRTTNYRREGYVRGAGYVDVGLELRGQPVLFLEAKRFGMIPASSQRTGDRTTEEKQAFRYTRGKKITYAILTNFERLHLFNADHERLIYPFDSPEDYLNNFEALWRLSPAEVEGGSLAWWEGQLEKKDVDLEFLAALRRWRLKLASAIHDHNAANPVLHKGDTFDFQRLMEAVQRILDRLILVRYGDDKEVLLTHDLLDSMLADYRNRGAYARPDHLMRDFIDLSRMMDEHHNTSLFAPGHVCEQVVLPNEPLAQVIDEMNRISFRKFTSDILGNTYESYLGTKLSLRQGQIQDEERRDIRKGHGIYYTPRWVVEYIVDNTLGCRLKELEEEHGVGAIEVVRGLAVVDPACGSGSFLIYAYRILADFYRRLNQAILDEQTRLVADLAAPDMFDRLERLKHLPQPVLDYPQVILEEHLFGVDLDPEAAEIAAVNLTMQAFPDSRQKRLPLILNENIKVGNSLVSGGEAELKPYLGEFWREKRPVNWEEEFPDIMARGGFDVVIGNPPYVNEARGNKELFRELKELPKLRRYYEKNMDLFNYFIEVGLDLLKQGGLLGYIIPAYWQDRTGATLLRSKIVKETNIELLVDLGEFRVFEAAPGQHNNILILGKLPPDKRTHSLVFAEIRMKDVYQEKSIPQFTEPKQLNYALVNGKLTIGQTRLNLLQKVGQQNVFCLVKDEVMRGVDTSPSTHEGWGVFVLDESEYLTLRKDMTDEQASEFFKPFYKANQINRYFYEPQNRYWLLYTDAKRRQLLENNRDKYRTIVEHLDKFKDVITSDNKPYGLHRPKTENKFLDENKILFVRKTPYPKFAFVPIAYFVDESAYLIIWQRPSYDLRYLLAILNSTLAKWWFAQQKRHGGQLQIDKEQILAFPIRRIDFGNPEEKAHHDRLVALVERMLELHRRKGDDSLAQSERDDFLREIERTDMDLGQIVYQLYGLTEEEITIVESAAPHYK